MFGFFRTACGLAGALIIAAAATQTHAASVVERPPVFDDQIQGAPIMVIGTVGEIVDQFDYQANVSGETGIERQFTDFAVKVEEQLKGAEKIDELVLRVVHGAEGDRLVQDVEPGERVVMTLAPSVLRGKERRPAYSLIYEGYYPVRDGVIVVPGDQGAPQKVELEALAERIKEMRASEAKRAQTAEPAEVQERMRAESPRSLETPADVRAEKPLPLAGPQGPANVGSPDTR